MRVSVIIPFYKVEHYIKRCATSLLTQTLDDVEFIFVDDASPDSSRDILLSVIKEHPEKAVTILTHQSNKGLPAARNTGLGVATGDYIYHCDSDDWLEPDMLEKLVGSAERNDADIVYCDFWMGFERNERYMSNPSYSNAEDLVNKGFLAGKAKYNVWNKLIKRSIYKESGIAFPEGHSMGEDMTIILLSTFAKKVAYVPEALYHYFKLNTEAFSNTRSAKHLEDIRFNAGRTLSFLENKVDPSFQEYFKLNIKLPFLLSENRDDYSVWKEWYPEANGYAMKNPELPFRTRFVQWAAANGQFWIVDLYKTLINKLYYGLKFK